MSTDSLREKHEKLAREISEANEAEGRRLCDYWASAFEAGVPLHMIEYEMDWLANQRSNNDVR